MMIRISASVCFLSFMVLLTAFPSYGQERSTQTIYFNIPSKGTGMDVLIFQQSVEGTELHEEDTTRSWQLYQEVNGAWVPKVSQIDKHHSTILYGTFTDSDKKGEVLKFRWRQEEKSPADPVITLQDNGKEFIFEQDGQSLVTYRYALMPLPEGVPQIYSRSGFIHPLKTPGGNLISRIQPSDHYHHYGLWHPWTKTHYRGEEIDFWNLIKGEGTVAFQEVLAVNEGPLFSDLTVVQHHNIHPGQGALTVLKETLTYRVWILPDTEDYYIVDVLYHMSPSTRFPLEIKEYRYQGFSLRGPAHWSDDNVALLTSDGKNKSDGNATRARWVKVFGPGDKTAESSVIMMTHPSNFNFPEQIRIWPTGSNGGKENVFINFNPAQDRDWMMHPGKTYTSQYRLIIGDRDFSTEETEKLWSLYSGIFER